MGWPTCSGTACRPWPEPSIRRPRQSASTAAGGSPGRVRSPAAGGTPTVSVGVAAAAVEAAVDLCKTKTPAYNATPLREQQLAQFQLGKAAARVEASRDSLYRAAEFAYSEVKRSNALLSPEAKIRLQLA